MTTPRRIDLNADLGEGPAPLIPSDALLLDLVSSASIACGFHAGDPMIMRATVRAAAERGVVIGAHPGYRDPQGFGRRAMDITPNEIAVDTIYQLGALQACCAAEGTRVRYVKPHGALYHRVAHDVEAAEAMVEAIAAVDSSLMMLGLADSALLHAAIHAGLRVAREGFLDRGMRADGTLVPRGEAGDVLHDAGLVAERAYRMVIDGVVESVDGTMIPSVVDSLCVHGDGANAVAMMQATRTRLEQAGVTITSFVNND